VVIPRDRRLRIALIGCGAVAEHYHLPALLASPEVDVVALVDTSIGRAQVLASRSNIPGAFASHTDLAGKIDLAVVAVPNAQHEHVAIDLLDAGVHVLVERPMARTTAECERMIAAGQRGQVLAVGHHFRFFPIARFARDWFAATPFGSIQRVDVRQSAGGSCLNAPDALSQDAGGGALLAFGVNVLDLLWWWFGELRVVSYRDDAAGGVEAEAQCEFALVDGTPVHVELSRLRNMRNTFIVECARGTVEIGIHEPAVVRVSVGDTGAALIGSVPDPAFERAPLRTVFARQLDNVVSAVRGMQVPSVGGVDGRRAVGLVEACYAVRQPLRRPWNYPEAYSALREASQ
jgi:predicted dehydrogenase